MATNEELKTSSQANNANLTAFMAAEVNNNPTAQDDQIAGEHSGAVYLTPATLLANDIDGDTIRGVSLQNAVNGTVHWDGQQVIFEPAAGYTGPASFEYTITDDKGGYDSATVNLNIVANAAPIAGDDSVEGYANTDIVIPATTLLANDSDADGDLLTGVSLQDAVNGTVAWDGENVTFTPNEGYEGPASFSYTIQDRHGATSTATVNLTIAPDTNTAPEAVDDLLVVASNRQVVIAPETLLANDSDLDGDSLEGIAIQDAVNGVVTWDGQYLTFTPNEGYEGPASFSYTITDHQGGEDTATVNIDVRAKSNVSDQFEAIDNKIFSKVDGTLDIPEYFLTDDDKGTDKTILNVHSAKHGTVELLDGVVKFTPEEGYLGPAEFSYTLQGSGGLTDIARVEIEVQAPRQILDAINESIGEAPTKIEGGIDQSYTIAHDDDFGYINYSNSYIYNAENVETFREGDALKLSPDDNFVGVASFDYIKRPTRWNRETDETEYSNWFEMGTARLNVQENIAPTIIDDAIVGITNQPLVTPIGRLLGNDVDPENKDLKLVSVDEVVNGSVEIVGGNIIFTPDQDFSGDASYRYTVKDSVNQTGSATVTLTFGEPVQTNLTDGDETLSFDEDTVFTVKNGDEGDLLNNATGQNPVIVSYTVAGNGNKIFSTNTDEYFSYYKDGVNTDRGAIRINSDGSFSIDQNDDGYAGLSTVPNNYHGALPAITYTVRDDSGLETSSTLNLNISAVNDAPYAVWFGTGGRGGTSLVSNVGEQPIVTPASMMALDHEGDELTLVSVQNAESGSVELRDGIIYYTAEAGFIGKTQFEVTISDGNSATTGNYYITVTDDIYQVPALSANDDQVVTSTNSDIVIPVSFLQVNDRYQTEGFGSRELSVEYSGSIISVQDAVNGVVTLADYYITFTPDEGYTGPASFNYTLQYQGLTETATVNLSIAEPVDNAPLVTNDDVVGFEKWAPSGEYGISLSELQKNDINDADLYLKSAYVNAKNGEISSRQGWDTRNYFFNPDSNEGGSGQFQYIASDRDGFISISNVTFNTPANSAPVGVGEKLFIADETVMISNRYLLDNDYDPDTWGVEIVSTQNATGGVVSSDATHVTFTVDAGSMDAPSFQYSIHDRYQEYSFAQTDVTVETSGNINGSVGRDLIYGNDGDNVLDGQAGSDVIIGGKGNDTLTGGIGTDTFVWSLADVVEGVVTRDVITDFTRGDDKLDLRDLIVFEMGATSSYDAEELNLNKHLDFNVTEAGDTEIAVSVNANETTELTIVLEGLALEGPAVNASDYDIYSYMNKLFDT